MKRSAPLKRTAFTRSAPQPWARPERPAQPLYRLARPCPQARISQDANPVRKTVRVESEAYRRLVAALPCAHCGIQGYSQAAHPNTGKAKGAKADDRLCFPLCADRPGVVGCHFRFDQHQLFSRPERAAIELKWASCTAAQIIAAGCWPANLPTYGALA